MGKYTGNLAACANASARMTQLKDLFTNYFPNFTLESDAGVDSARVIQYAAPFTSHKLRIASSTPKIALRNMLNDTDLTYGTSTVAYAISFDYIIVTNENSGCLILKEGASVRAGFCWGKTVADETGAFITASSSQPTAGVCCNQYNTGTDNSLISMVPTGTPELNNGPKFLLSNGGEALIPAFAMANSNTTTLNSELSDMFTMHNFSGLLAGTLFTINSVEYIVLGMYGSTYGTIVLRINS